MFLRLVLGALRYRRQRLLLAFAALAVGAALATVLFGIYGTVAARLRDEFRSYGANIAAVPVNGSTVPMDVVEAAEKAGAEAAPFVISSARVDGRMVAVAAFIPAKTAPLTTYWHMQGNRDITTGECIAGQAVADELGLRLGAGVPIEPGPCRLKGIVSTGGAEDNEILVPLAPSSTTASLIEIRAPGDRLEGMRSQLAARFPGVEFRVVRAVASTETNVVLKTRASLFLLTLVILIVTTLCVTGNFTEMAIERSKEIAILKALGGMERKIAALFVSESAALAFGATVAGYLGGLIVAALIGRQVFGGGFHLQPDPVVFGSVALVMLIVAAVATGIAASRIWKVEPAIILRGE